MNALNIAAGIVKTLQDAEYQIGMGEPEPWFPVAED